MQGELNNPAALRLVAGHQSVLQAPQGAAASSPELRIAQARQTIEQAEREIAEKAKREAVLQRLEYEETLAHYTRVMLHEIRCATLGTGAPAPRDYLTQFRKELSPLAESYGFKIKVVGNKDVAVLTRI